MHLPSLTLPFLACALSAPAHAAPAPARLVAIGDLHADLTHTLATLRMAGLVDETGHWAGGTATWVQTGDITDRGPDGLAVLELIDRLEAEAAKAGGRVIPLIGNHEAMNIRGDWRYVSPKDIASFGGEAARRTALGADAPHGQHLRERDAVVMVGDTVFAHGGVSARFAPRGVPALAAEIRHALDTGERSELLGSEGPMWYRGYLLNPEAIACAELDAALKDLGAARMVVGHTTQQSGRVAARCGGKLLGIDTGISAHYGGHHSAVEFRNGDAWVIYPSGPEDLPDP